MNNSDSYSPKSNNSINILSPQQSSFQKNILLFKDEVLKDLKKIENKLNLKFENCSSSLENKLNDYNLKIENVSQKVNDLSNLISVDKNIHEKIDSLLQFKAKMKDEYMAQELKINSNYKELHDSIFNHDKLISESIIYPGIIGQMCRFKNLHQFIDFVLINIKELLSHKDKNITEFKNYKNKIDTMIKNIKNQFEGITKSMSDYTKKCVSLTEVRLTDLIKVYDNRINEIRLENSKHIIELQSKNENPNHENKNINDKNDIDYNLKKEIEFIKQTNNNINSKIENYKNDCHQIKEQISKLDDFLKEIELKVNRLNEKRNEIDYNVINNSKNKINDVVKNENNNNKKNEPVKKGKIIESFLKKYIQGEVGVNDIINRNNIEENSNENKIPNINHLEEKHNLKNNNNNHNNNIYINNNDNVNNKLTKNNSYSNNIMLKNNFKNSGNNFYHPDNSNEENINSFSQRKFFQRLKNINFQDKNYLEHPSKNKALIENISDSKIQNNNKNDSDSNLKEEPKQLNLPNNKHQKSMSLKDIKQFAARSYSIFPKLPKRNIEKSDLKIARSFSDEDERNLFISYKNNILDNNNNKNNDNYKNKDYINNIITSVMNLKKMPIGNLSPKMFNSIDGEKSYFNNKNSSVSFIGNSIQVIHSKKHYNTIKNIKSEIKEKEKEIIESYKKKKEIVNSSSRINEAKELEKYVNQIKENISYHKLEKNNYDDDIISKKLFFDKNKTFVFKKNKDSPNFSLDKNNNLLNCINENSEIKYSKLSKILNNIPKNIPKKNLLLNNSDKFSLNFYKDEDK